MIYYFVLKILLAAYFVGGGKLGLKPISCGFKSYGSHKMRRVIRRSHFFISFVNGVFVDLPAAVNLSYF